MGEFICTEDILQYTEHRKAVNEAMTPIEECPVCGLEPETRVSFKGRVNYRNRRKTQLCECGWSRILPTEREALIELGII